MIGKGSILCLLTAGCLWAAVWPAEVPAEVPANQNKEMALVLAVMCEYIDAYEPRHLSAVFSIDVGQISCFTSFDGIKKPTHVFHKWYRRDRLVTTKRLTLRPPSWSTYSSIQLREADIGPWCVEVRNQRNRLLQTLRFSVTE